MPLQATSGAASYDGFGGGVAVEPVYIEQIFSTYLYTGTGASQTITNGIDLSGKGGLVWLKSRNNATSNYLLDTVQGGGYALSSDSTGSQISVIPALTFNSDGFTSGAQAIFNGSSRTFASWTFREQPKFFDVVTYTGDGLTGKVISHSLGSVPGCIIFKRTDSTSDWAIYHRSLNGGVGPEDYRVFLNTTAAQTSGPSYTLASVNSTSFTLGSNGAGGGSALTNVSGATYVAYLFAHNAGGFGLTGTDNVISCGSFTTDGSGNATVSLGYEPQWVLYKPSTAVNNWKIFDNMRGMVVGSGDQALYPNTSGAEVQDDSIQPAATGFSIVGGDASATHIYIAIRRGPMKVPTSGTSVFSPVAYTGNSTSGRLITSNFPVDLTINSTVRTAVNTDKLQVFPRLTGGAHLATASTAAEVASSTILVTGFDSNTAIKIGNGSDINSSGSTYVNWMFRRAPSFMDEVCYTGDAIGNRKINHNLTVAPELLIVKKRSSATLGSWRSYAAPLGATQAIDLNSNAAAITYSIWNNTAPTTTQFTVQTNYANSSGDTFVAYLFASCPGVSKVGSFTGTGATQVINCGFTGGARFVLIKRTDSTGDWYVWDTARGIVAGNDPYLLLNSTAAETTTTDYIDTYSAGFEISSTAPAAINASGGSFVFLAIA